MKPQIIPGHPEDLGGFSVHRVLPGPGGRFVGPFVFFDHFGPLTHGPTRAIEVRPHPHIGLATVTYLFEGRITHRDSLGNVQNIGVGDLNWMTAGRGIVHSERTPLEDRNPQDGHVTHGIQIWTGLPKDQEECNPSFFHWDQAKLPLLRPSPGLEMRVLAGESSGARSPVPTLSATLLLDLKASGDGELRLPVREREVGVYLVSGAASVNGATLEPHQMAVFAGTDLLTLQLKTASRVIVLGGEPFPERRHMWWNFVSSSRARIAQASQAWADQTLGQVIGETEYAPLPDDEDA